MAFPKHHCQFQYLVMLFGITNAPETAQCYINDCLQPCIDNFVVYYHVEILIHSAHDNEDAEHVSQALQPLTECGANWTEEKCEFRVLQVHFLGGVITPITVRMESDSISTIERWLMVKSVSTIQLVLGLMKFYPWFIWKYVKVTLILTKLVTKLETTLRGKIGTHSAKW